MRRGTTVGGRYRLVRGPLRGGMGEVWIARDQRLPREVILKRLRPQGRGATRPDRQESDRLEAEARALARFSNPHVVTLHDVLTLPEGTWAWPRRRTASWLVMEYVAGGSLADRPPLAPERAARVGAQVAAALAALHAEGVVHGDVKPGNVVATPQGLAKLADFGGAYRVGGRDTAAPPGALSYTPDYAAPEVVRGRPEPASDVFSLAALVHALVTGRPPRPVTGGGVAPAVAERQAARGEVALGPGLGPLRALLPAMLDAEPGNRPDAAEAGRLLAGVAGPQEPLPPPRANAEGDDEGDGVGQDSGPGPGRHALPGRTRQFAIAVGVAAVTLATAVWMPGLWPDEEDDDSGRHGRDGRRPVLGDHRTADPCALADPAALDRFGDARLRRGLGGFDRCDVLVDTGDGRPVDVRFRLANGGATGLPAPHRTVGDVAVVRGGDGDGPGALDGPEGSGDPGGHGSGGPSGPDGGSGAPDRSGGADNDADLCVRTLLPATDPGTHVSVVAEVMAGRDEGDGRGAGDGRGRRGDRGGRDDRHAQGDRDAQGGRQAEGDHHPQGDRAPRPSPGDVGARPLCALADVAAHAAARRLGAGPLARRPDPAPGSLVREDACALLDARALAALPGAGARDPEPGFGNWSCTWGSTAGGPRLEVRLGWGRVPDVRDGALTRVAGRRAVVEPDAAGPRACRVRVVHRVGGGTGGGRAVESLDVVVAGGGIGDDGSRARLRRLALGFASAAA
ncbi:serine/threonine-protein kinase, partial [Streptomyces longispororuber]|uniref:serine/threonine-protein kinase n=1 Tax=Streptomyces longispororuber TaxID=68230 RepID=UPI00167DFFF4